MFRRHFRHKNHIITIEADDYRQDNNNPDYTITTIRDHDLSGFTTSFYVDVIYDVYGNVKSEIGNYVVGNSYNHTTRVYVSYPAVQKEIAADL